MNALLGELRRRRILHDTIVVFMSDNGYSWGAHRIEGKGDSIAALDGNDVVLAGAGNDTLAGGAGNDELRGGPGSDSIFGGSGDDNLVARDSSPTTWNAERDTTSS